MKIEQEDPTAIEIPDRLRSVVPAKVKQLAESMAAIGLQQPVTVWMPVDGQLELVAGAHRVKAACDLGWDWIDCIFADGMNDIDRQLWEIHENLIRAELTPLENAEHYARHDDLWKVRAQKSGKSLPTLTGRGNKAGAAEIAEKTGVSKRAVNLAISRARDIPKDVRDQIRGTDLDKGTYLDDIKGLPPEKQRLKVKYDLLPPLNPEDQKQFENLKRLWEIVNDGFVKLSPENRRKFLTWKNEYITPVTYGRSDDGGGDG